MPAGQAAIEVAYQGSIQKFLVRGVGIWGPDKRGGEVLHPTLARGSKMTQGWENSPPPLNMALPILLHMLTRAMLQHSKASERANVRIETINFLKNLCLMILMMIMTKKGGLSSFAAQLHVERRDARTGKGLFQ